MERLCKNLFAIKIDRDILSISLNFAVTPITMQFETLFLNITFINLNNFHDETILIPMVLSSFRMTKFNYISRLNFQYNQSSMHFTFSCTYSLGMGSSQSYYVEKLISISFHFNVFRPKWENALG